jgi:hypothetical protein
MVSRGEGEGRRTKTHNADGVDKKELEGMRVGGEKLRTGAIPCKGRSSAPRQAFLNCNIPISRSRIPPPAPPANNTVRLVPYSSSKPYEQRSRSGGDDGN